MRVVPPDYVIAEHVEVAAHTQLGPGVQQMAVKLAPGQLSQPAATRTIVLCHSLGEAIEQRRHTLPRAENTKRQIGRQATGAIERREIPLLAVIGKLIGNKTIEPLPGRPFTHWPVMAVLFTALIADLKTQLCGFG